MMKIKHLLLSALLVSACGDCDDQGGDPDNNIRIDIDAGPGSDSSGDNNTNNGNNANNENNANNQNNANNSNNANNQNNANNTNNQNNNCGDGTVDPGELCDDGDQDDGDYCAADCQAVTGECGDDIVQTNEVCDGEGCTLDCQTELIDLCGNGTLDTGEQCDDGNLQPSDYCSADCQTITGSCGDQIMQANEACDDGNVQDDDYCASDCQTITGECGDQVVQTNEQCDDGNVVGNDYCEADCSTVTGSCGDQILQGNESCDDGVTASCGNTHNGGDGSCVPIGTCSAGYMLDMGVCKPTNTTGLTVPCSNGSGYAMYKFHYDSGSTSARIDVWDANCSYSFASGSACNVYEICPGFCDVNTTSAGYPIFTSTHYLRVRYNANGFNFTNATLWVQARSYNTSASTNFEAWSPIYGSVFGGPVSNSFNYDWYSVDWSNHLSPFDQPSLTAIQLYAQSGSLAVKGVELCVE